MRETRTLLRALFDAAVAAALPERIIPAHLPAPPLGRTIVLGAAMAKAVEDHWPGAALGLGRNPATTKPCPAGRSRTPGLVSGFGTVITAPAHHTSAASTASRRRG